MDPGFYELFSFTILVNILKGKRISKLCMMSICKFCGLPITLYNNIKFLNGMIFVLPVLKVCILQLHIIIKHFLRSF